MGFAYRIEEDIPDELTREYAEQGLIFAESTFPVSSTFWIAVALLLLGFGAIISMVFKIALFG